MTNNTTGMFEHGKQLLLKFIEPGIDRLSYDVSTIKEEMSMVREELRKSLDYHLSSKEQIADLKGKYEHLLDKIEKRITECINENGLDKMTIMINECMRTNCK